MEWHPSLWSGSFYALFFYPPVSTYRSQPCSIDDGQYITSPVRLGSRADSFYEYLLQVHKFLGIGIYDFDSSSFQKTIHPDSKCSGSLFEFSYKDLPVQGYAETIYMHVHFPGTFFQHPTTHTGHRCTSMQ